MSAADTDEEDWSETEDADLDAAAPCPECGAAIYADLDHCPQCGHWLTDADHRGRESGVFRSRNLKIVAIVALVAFLAALLLSGITMF